ncbi:cytochrome P450 [Pseudonocardia eucalypti]|uniref:Cytochrome P450 n=1 Tax=Pseudonocardia eucalypti TaxID=648755 RepID=A0ABP9QFU7_9PSEU|nr:cytochrome P450 [Pseudonocardia eucalypti]
MGDSRLTEEVSLKRLTDIPVAPGRLPGFGHVWPLLRRPFTFLESLRTIGQIVRVDFGRTPLYMLTRPELIHEVMVNQARLAERGGMFDKGCEIFGNGLLTSNGEFHLRQRRLMQPPLHRNHIGAYAGLMCDNTQKLSESWRAGRHVDICHEMSDLITINTTRAMFGLDLDDDATQAVRRIIPTLSDTYIVYLQTPKSLERLPIPANRRFKMASRSLHDIIDSVIERRLERPKAPNDDLLGKLISARHPDTGEAMGRRQLHDEVITIFLAGVVTTATTLAWTFRELERHPDVEARILDELGSLLDTDVPLDEAVHKLDYTPRVLDEVLRLHPFLLGMRVAAQPLLLGGVEIPSGTQLGFSPYTVHRDPCMYPDPMRVDPDRWLSDRARHLPPGAFTTFGMGRHRCIGEFFAQTQVLIALAILLPRWKLRSVPRQDVHEVNGIHPRPSSLRMVPHPREP